MAESGKVTAWVAVKVELESCEVWAADLPCSDACTYEHEHEILGECTDDCADDCNLEHEDYSEPCASAATCRDYYDHLDLDQHRPDWEQAELVDDRALIQAFKQSWYPVDGAGGTLQVGHWDGTSWVSDRDASATWRWQVKDAAWIGVPEVIGDWDWHFTSTEPNGEPHSMHCCLDNPELAVTPAVTERLCACGCGRPVTSPRPEARYATGACRVRAHRAK